jgi:hypothetical protein
MSAQKSEPLRGEAAYRASIKATAERNSAAQAAAARRREAKERTSLKETARLAKLEARDLPRQPGT